MKLLNLEQGTPEWHTWRRTRRMASYAPAVVGECPFTKPREVLAFYRDGTQKEFSAYAQKILAHGHDNEAAVRAHAAGVLGDFLTPMCVENGDYAASLDGLTDDQKIFAECKAPAKGRASHTWQKALNGDPGHYMWQLQHQLMVTGCERGLFVVGVFEPEEHIEIWVEPDKGMREVLVEAWDRLWADVMLGKGGERTDDAWVAAVAAYRAAKAACAATDQALEEAKQALIKVAASDCDTGCGLRVQQIPGKKGNVDYAKIPELKGVDLEAYRKPAGKPYWQVNEVNDEVKP